MITSFSVSYYLDIIVALVLLLIDVLYHNHHQAYTVHWLSLYALLMTDVYVQHWAYRYFLYSSCPLSATKMLSNVLNDNDAIIWLNLPDVQLAFPKLTGRIDKFK